MLVKWLRCSRQPARSTRPRRRTGFHTALRAGCWWHKVWSHRCGGRSARRRPNADSSNCSLRDGPQPARPEKSACTSAPVGTGAIGARKVGNTRILADGTVIDYTTGTRYTQPVKTDNCGRAAAGMPDISRRYLVLADRLAIADGLSAGQTLAVIAAGIGKHTSTVSREIRARSVEGVYLPYRAHTVAAVARARPKQSKLVTNHKLRQAVRNGLRQRLSPEQISHRLVKDFPTDESMRVSHETITSAITPQTSQCQGSSLPRGRAWC